MGNSRKLVIGVNDIITIRPHLKDEWDYEKNLYNPEQYTYGSRERVHWKCKYGHEWIAMIYERYRGTGCPVCNGRYNTSYPEQFLFNCLKQLYPNTINRGKFQGYEFDIAIPELKTCIEYSGEHWEHNKQLEKLELCRKHNVRFVEILESKKINNEINIINDYTFMYGSYSNKEKYLLMLLEKILHIDISIIDIEKAKQEAIINSKCEISDTNRLSNNALLVSEWSYKNAATPDDYTSHSGFKAIWICSICNHEWEARINDRSRGQGCPKCKARKTSERNLEHAQTKANKGNNLINFSKELCNDWDYIKNDLSPEQVTPGSNKKVWWKCATCGHSWQAMIYSRAKLGRGCPECWKYRNSHRNGEIQ